MAYTLTSDAGHVLAQGPNLSAPRFSIECWYPLGAVSYSASLWSDGEGWAYAEGKRLGYIEARQEETR